MFASHRNDCHHGTPGQLGGQYFQPVSYRGNHASPERQGWKRDRRNRCFAHGARRDAYPRQHRWFNECYAAKQYLSSG